MVACRSIGLHESGIFQRCLNLEFAQNVGLTELHSATGSTAKVAHAFTGMYIALNIYNIYNDFRMILLE